MYSILLMRPGLIRAGSRRSGWFVVSTIMRLQAPAWKMAKMPSTLHRSHKQQSTD